MVYVDDSRIPYKRLLMGHVIADTPEELVAAAEAVGMKAAWLQNLPSGVHFDACLEKRRLLVKNGAVQISARTAAAMNARRKATGSLGRPEDAVAWWKSSRAERRRSTKAT